MLRPPVSTLPPKTASSLPDHDSLFSTFSDEALCELVELYRSRYGRAPTDRTHWAALSLRLRYLCSLPPKLERLTGDLCRKRYEALQKRYGNQTAQSVGRVPVICWVRAARKRNLDRTLWYLDHVLTTVKKNAPNESTRVTRSQTQTETETETESELELKNENGENVKVEEVEATESQVEETTTTTTTTATSTAPSPPQQKFLITQSQVDNLVKRIHFGQPVSFPLIVNENDHDDDVYDENGLKKQINFEKILVLESSRSGSGSGSGTSTATTNPVGVVGGSEPNYAELLPPPTEICVDPPFVRDFFRKLQAMPKLSAQVPRPAARPQSQTQTQTTTAPRPQMRQQQQVSVSRPTPQPQPRAQIQQLHQQASQRPLSSYSQPTHLQRQQQQQQQRPPPRNSLGARTTSRPVLGSQRRPLDVDATPTPARAGPIAQKSSTVADRRLGLARNPARAAPAPLARSTHPAPTAVAPTSVLARPQTQPQQLQRIHPRPTQAVVGAVGRVTPNSLVVRVGSSAPSQPSHRVAPAPVATLIKFPQKNVPVVAQPPTPSLKIQLLSKLENSAATRAVARPLPNRERPKASSQIRPSLPAPKTEPPATSKTQPKRAPLKSNRKSKFAVSIEEEFVPEVIATPRRSRAERAADRAAARGGLIVALSDSKDQQVKKKKKKSVSAHSESNEEDFVPEVISSPRRSRAERAAERAAMKNETIVFALIESQKSTPEVKKKKKKTTVNLRRSRKKSRSSGRSREVALEPVHRTSSRRVGRPASYAEASDSESDLASVATRKRVPNRTPPRRKRNLAVIPSPVDSPVRPRKRKRGAASPVEERARKRRKVSSPVYETRRSLGHRVALASSLSRSAAETSTSVKLLLSNSVEEILRHEDAYLFENPVPRDTPMYYATIENPICLREILDRVNSFAVTTALDLWEDLSLLIGNAKQFNEEDSPIYEMAIRLGEHCREVIVRTLKKECRLLGKAIPRIPGLNAPN